jgi:hypothetical protein
VFTEIPDFTPQNQAGAKCTFCKQHARDMEDGSRARTFRTPTHIHMEGWIEVCERCIREMAVKIGMISTAQAEELEELRHFAEEHAVAVHDDLAAARATIVTLSAELARTEDETAKKVTKSYDRGYEDGEHGSAVTHEQVLDAAV